MFTESYACESRAHCRTCRSSPRWRASMAAAFGGPVDFPCPIGLPILGQPRRAGDWLARLTHWLRIKRKPGCGCERRQAWLNRWGAWIIAGGAAGAIAWIWIMP